MMLALGSALVFPYTFMPILVTLPANQDVWIVLWLSIPYTIIIDVPLLFLINKFRGIIVNDIAEIILGKVLGKVIIFLFILFFLYCFIACMLITSHFINLYLLPKTPLWGVYLFAVIPVSYASYKGSGTLGRLSNFIVPYVIITIFMFLFMGTELMDVNIIKPIMSDSKFIQINLGAIYTSLRFSEILIFFVFSYFLNEKVSINKTYIATLFTFIVLYTLILIPTMLTLGLEYAKHAWNPYYIFIRQVEAFGFLERLQAVNTLAWFPVVLLKLSMYNYMTSFVFSRLSRRKSHKYYVIPVSIIAFLVCIIPIVNKSSTIELLRSDKVFPLIMFPIVFLIPLLMVIVYFVRKKKIDKVIKELKSNKSIN